MSGSAAGDPPHASVEVSAARRVSVCLGETVDDDGIDRVSFDLACDDEVVPGVIWRHRLQQTPRPVVLLAHGRTRDKLVPYVAAVGRQVAISGEAVAVCLDAPGHGDRPPLAGAWDETVAVRAAHEATLAADALTDQGVATPERAFWGLSMGALVGLYWASRDVHAAALAIGLLGLSERVPAQRRAAAEQVRCPTLFHSQLDDEGVGASRARTMYDAIGALDKRLTEAPGDHWAVPQQVRDDMVAFLLSHLGLR